MVKKIQAVAKVKKVGKVKKRHLTMKGLYYRELMKRMFNYKITIEENTCEEEHLGKEKHILDKFV